MEKHEQMKAFQLKEKTSMERVRMKHRQNWLNVTASYYVELQENISKSADASSLVLTKVTEEEWNMFLTWKVGELNNLIVK
jgi:hypothetical protein